MACTLSSVFQSLAQAYRPSTRISPAEEVPPPKENMSPAVHALLPPAGSNLGDGAPPQWLRFGGKTAKRLFRRRHERWYAGITGGRRVRPDAESAYRWGRVTWVGRCWGWHPVTHDVSSANLPPVGFLRHEKDDCELCLLVHSSLNLRF